MKINTRNGSDNTKAIHDKQLPPINSKAPPMPPIKPPKQSKIEDISTDFDNDEWIW